jgi:hypothetical protein
MEALTLELRKTHAKSYNSGCSARHGSNPQGVRRRHRRHQSARDLRSSPRNDKQDSTPTRQDANPESINTGKFTVHYIDLTECESSDEIPKAIELAMGRDKAR